MKNIHLVPTNEPSRLFKDDNQVLNLHTHPVLKGIFTNGIGFNQHIYITSSEEIKQRNWIFDLDMKKVVNADNLKVITSKKSQCWYYKKIILTTDPKLIADGVQSIDDEFLEWFVKNPSCEYVPIITTTVNNESIYKTNIGFESWRKEESKQLNLEDFELPKFGTKEFNDLASSFFGGKPRLKEERICNCGLKESEHNVRHPFIPKQETIEEAAERIYDDNLFNYEKYRDGFIEGAKWQQEQDKNKYSEKEVLELLKKIHFVDENYKEWFDKNKKK